MANEFRTRIIWRIVIILALAIVAGLSLWNRGLRLGLDLQGGTELLYSIKTEGLTVTQRSGVTQRTIDIVRKRIDPEGTMELEIREFGSYRFLISLPGMSAGEAERIEERIQRSGRLLFCMVNTDDQDIARASSGDIVPGYTPFLIDETAIVEGERRYRRADYRELEELNLQVRDWLGRDGITAVLVNNVPEMSGEDLEPESVIPTTDQAGGRAVGFRFGGEARRRFANLTERNIGKHMAIILDDTLYSAPVIQSRISGPGIISSPQGFSREESDDLIILLRSGSLPADIELQWKHDVGPKLGEDSIIAGQRAAMVGLVFVVILMGVYYLGPGLIANFALLLNLLLVLGALSFIQATLTLPGIAGLILTVGMAVDANVLILERIREEKERGKTLRLAVKNGYERAFTTIIDANLTTLITAVILFFVGTGPIKGFATVLSIGILFSMFSALFVTRALTELLIEADILRNMKMLRMFGQLHIHFSKGRSIAMICSAVFIIVGMVVFIQRGDRKYDSDLLGGFMADMELAVPLTAEEFRARVATAGYPDADVQSLWIGGERHERDQATRFSIRVRELGADTGMEKIEEDIARQLRGSGLHERIERLADWTYQISLSRPTTEEELRRELQRAGYQMTDIVRLIAENAVDNQFAIHYRGRELDERDTREFISDLQAALGGLIATRVATFTGGDIVQEGQYYYTELVFNQSVPVTVLEAGIRQRVSGAAADEYLTVAGAGRDEGAEDALHVRVESSDRSILREFLNDIGPERTVTLPLIARTRPGVVEIETSEIIAESALRNRMGGGLERRVRALVPIEATTNAFILETTRLPETKAMEKIKLDLEREFADVLARVMLDAELERMAAPPQFIRFPEEGDIFIRLSVRDPETGAPRLITFQNIADNLRRAGEEYEAALLLTEEQRRNPHEFTDTAFIRVNMAGVAPEDAEEKLAAMSAEIQEAFSVPDPFRRIESVGPLVAGEMKSAAFLAVAIALAAIVFYIWFRFGEFKFGMAAVLTLMHDVLVVMGAVAIADALSGTGIGRTLGFSDIKINLPMIGAFMTLVGYSLNDTIVVFDRIRENLGGKRRAIEAGTIDLSLNQTLSRTLLTSATTLIVVLSLYILGGPVIHGFAFALLIGVIVGTYSSVFIATPLLLDWPRISGAVRGAFAFVTPGKSRAASGRKRG